MGAAPVAHKTAVRGLLQISNQTTETVPRFPGMLDNTVAGGIPSGMSIFESLVKECMEEASLEDSLVRAHTRAVGSISYFYRYVHIFLADLLTQ